MSLFAFVISAIVLSSDVAGSSPVCPQILNGTCLANSLPILQELSNVTTAGDCCAACTAMSTCVSWTLNTDQKKCHLRASFKDKTSRAVCTSGQVRTAPSPAPPAPTPPAPKGAKNVLFVVVDDLRPQIGAYNVSVCGGMRMNTPNIDSLASRGLTFRHHYTQYAVCSPSRNSFMSGRRPDTTLTYNFKDSFREAPGGDAMIALPEYFKLNGYNVTGIGKTYHAGHPANFDQPRSWSEDYKYPGYNQGLGFCGKRAACALAENDTKHFTDDGIAAGAIALMKSHKANGIGPWFLGVGFIRPHVDWSSPQRFWDLYPEDKCAGDLAKYKTAPPTSPKIAWVDGDYVDKKSDDLGKDYKFNASVPVPDDVATRWRRGYYAAVSYMDWNLGKVLAALDELNYTDDTVVSLIGDHGYQLGEHSMWEKYTNWELAARIPWVLSVPAKPSSHGKVTTALTENVDLYPTLATAAGLPTPAVACDGCVEGEDATPLLDEPHRAWKKASFSQYARCNQDAETGYYGRCSGDALHSKAFQAMGYSVRTEQWRYTEWFGFNYTSAKANFNVTIARELYDHTTDLGNDFDAYDQVNKVDDPQYADIVKEHAKLIRDGWIHARPPSAEATFEQLVV